MKKRSEQKLGKAIGIIAKAEVREILAHEFGLDQRPGLVGRASAKRLRAARRRAKAESGLSRRAFNIAMQKLPRKTMDAAIGRLYAQMDPYARRLR